MKWPKSLRLPDSHWTRRKLPWVLVLVLLATPTAWIATKIIRLNNAGIWIPAAVSELTSGRYLPARGTTHIMFMMCDHWEPGGGEKGLAIAEGWLDRFESIAAQHLDSTGRPFQYSWFYPIDNFDTQVLARISQSVNSGFGEIEVHWHHHHPDSASFAADLRVALNKFTEVGALISETGGKPRFAFIHGNWTLDNSGKSKYCGVDDEIQVLTDHGCYADFTFPALGNPAQPSTINQIFFTHDTPDRKSYEVNPQPAKVGQVGEGLMMFPGPLGFDFNNPWIFFEYGSLDDAEGTGITGLFRRPDSPSGYFKEHRVNLWNKLGARVEGHPQWVFVKIHAHGVQHREILLGGALDHMLGSLTKYCRENEISLHYVTAREGYNLVRALEAGQDGPPQDFYNYEIPPPLNRKAIKTSAD